MEYIDKTVLEEFGEAIIDAFLHRLKAIGANYPKDLYKTFKSDKDKQKQFTKDKLIEVLLLEQNEYCCYCMRRLLLEDNVTLEHLILNVLKDNAEFKSYLKRKTVLNDKVCIASDFISNEETQTPPYPHTVAYQNLIASCNGEIIPGSKTVYCCNLKRKSEFIEPIVLYESIKDEIVYHSNGRATWRNESADIPTLNKLGLNDSILRMIRRIWATIKRKKIEFNHIKRAHFLYEVLTEFSDKEFKDSDDFDMLFNFQKDIYWNLLDRYRYFGE